MSGASVCSGLTLPEPKHDWRCIAGFITREYNKDRLNYAQPVNYIGTHYSQYTPYPNFGQYQHSYDKSAYLEELDESQGNGRGLSA